MSRSPADVLRAKLVTDGIIVSPWIGIVSKIPTTPDTVIAFYDYGGGSPEPHLNIDRPAVQVRVRAGAIDYEAGRLKCKQIKDKLLGFMSQTLDGDQWISISMVGDINFLRRDEQDRPEWTLNFNILKESALEAGSERVAI